MKLSNIAKLAMISAVVLTLALKNETAKAACGTTATATTIDAEVPYDINVCAAIDNVFDATVTDLDFGTIGATHKNGQYGCLIMDPADGSLDESNSTCSSADADRARLVSDDQAGTAAEINIAAGGAFNSQEVRMLIQVGDETLTCTAGTSPDLIIASLTSDQTTPATWTLAGGVDVATRNGAAVTGISTTGASGDLIIKIGGELRTDSSAPNTEVYDTGTCEGTFNVTLFY